MGQFELDLSTPESAKNLHDPVYIPYMWKFLPGEKFRQFRHLLLLAKFLSRKYFVLCYNDYIEDMATFTTLAKIYFTDYFCNT